MSLNDTDVTDIVGRGAPVLFLDTCLMLDLMRGVMRDGGRPHEFVAALALLVHAEATPPRLTVLLAQQVRDELAGHQQVVKTSAEEHMANVRQNIARIHDIAETFGATRRPDVSAWDGHVDRTEAVLNRVAAASRTIPQSPDIGQRALARMLAPRIPARKGKESTKDCLVVETCLEAARQLRTAGLGSPFVFASSNTRDYCVPPGSTPEPDIVTDFGAWGIEFAPNFGAAKHSAGL